MRSSSHDVDAATAQQPVFLVVPGLVVLALVIATSTTVTPHLRADEQRVIELVVLLTVLVLSVAVPTLRTAVFKLVADGRRVVLLSLGGFGIGVASAAVALEPAQGLLEVALHVLLAWLVIVIAASARSEPQDTSTFLLLGLVAVATIYSLGFLAVPDLVPQGEGLWLRRFGGGFPNPRYLGHLYVFTVPLAVAASVADRLPRPVRVLAGLVGASGWWAMVLTAERGTPVAWVVGAAAAVLLSRGVNPSGRRFLVRHAFVAVAGVVAGVATRIGLVLAAGGGLTLGSILDKDVTSSSGRMALWDHTLDLAIEHPLLGIGPGHSAHIDYLLTPTFPTSPHNMPLRVLAEWGVPFSIVLLIVGVAGIVGLRRRPMFGVRLPDVGLDATELRLALTTSVASGLALSLVSGVDVTAVGQLFLATTIGWLVGLGVKDPTPERTPSWLPLAVVVVMGAAAWPVTATLINSTPSELREDAQTALERDEAAPVLQPRFWTQGVIGLDGEQAQN